MRDEVDTEQIAQKWLTEKQVSVLTAMSLSTLRAHRFKRCGLPYTKFGKSVHYALADVEAFMKEHKIFPATGNP